MESTYSARKSQGLDFKPCEGCAEDISHRHYVARFCLKCSEQNRLATRKKQPELRSVPRCCARCGTEIAPARAHVKWPPRHCTECNYAHSRQQDAIRSITRKAVAVGFLADPKTLICADCGCAAQCYDHRDYNKPLEVEPVCLSCNLKRGRGIEFSGVLLKPSAA